MRLSHSLPPSPEMTFGQKAAYMVGVALLVAGCTPAPDAPPQEPAGVSSSAPNPSPSVGTPAASANKLAYCPPEKEFARPLPKGATPFYVNPGHPFHKGVKDMRESGQYPQFDCHLDRLGQVAVADWVGDWTAKDEKGNTIKDENGNIDNSRVTTHIRSLIEAAQAEEQMPLLVGYNIRNRDLKGKSAGGAETDEEYLRWVRAVSKGIGSSEIVVVWEPDAAKQMLLMEEDPAKERKRLLQESLKILNENNPNAMVYLDAGNDDWDAVPAPDKRSPVEETADVIRTLDPEGALVWGFVAGVASYGTLEQSRKYLLALNKELGWDVPNLIDMSRSGAIVPDRANFCNNPNARIGEIATQYYVGKYRINVAWIKEPGISDGDCKDGQVAAGTFDSRFLSTLMGAPAWPYAA